MPDVANRPVNFDLKNDPTYQTPNSFPVKNTTLRHELKYDLDYQSPNSIPVKNSKLKPSISENNFINEKTTDLSEYQIPTSNREVVFPSSDTSQ